MSNAKRDSSIKSKSKPSEGKCQKSNVRVGSEYQISIPDFTETRPANYFNEPSEREEKVWNPKLCPSSSDLNAYISEAKKLSYPLDAALALLHYHKYNIQHAIDDLPNYEPILNNYTKSAVRSFLKSVDGRPRKNFVKVSRDFPGYTMGEIQGLYYAIAAPFKAQSRRCPKYTLQMRNCYQKALKLGFTANHSASELHKCGTDPDEVVADTQFEGYFHQIMSADRASKLCKCVIRGRPYGSKVNGNGNGNGAKGSTESSRGMAANGALAPNRRQAFTEPFRRVAHKIRKNGKYMLQNFKLVQFIDFTGISETDVEEELAKSNSQLVKMDEDLKKSTEEIEITNEEVFKDLDSLYPRRHFENEVTFRWTKSEFAILVMALDAYGKDFAHIAKIMATKTESMIRDFYNKYNMRFELDAFINKENKKPKEENKAEEVASNPLPLIESAGDAFENEVVQNDEPPLIIATPQKSRTQSNSSSLQKSVAVSSSKSTKSPEEEKVELPSQKSENEETKEEKEPEAPEIKKEEDSVAVNETPKSRRGRARKETPVRRVSTRSLSNESPASAVRRRSSKSVKIVQTPRRQRKPSTPTTVEQPAPRPRGRPPLKKLAEKVQESSPSSRSSKGTKGGQSSSTTKFKAKESPAVVSKRKLSIDTQEVSEVPKKRARNSSLSPRSSRLRR